MAWIVFAATFLVVTGLALWFAHGPKPDKGDRDAQEYAVACKTLATIIGGVDSEDVHRALCFGAVGWRERYAKIVLADSPEEAFLSHAPPTRFGAHNISVIQKAYSDVRISCDAAKAATGPFLSLSQTEMEAMFPDAGRRFP